MKIMPILKELVNKNFSDNFKNACADSNLELEKREKITLSSYGIEESESSATDNENSQCASLEMKKSKRSRNKNTATSPMSSDSEGLKTTPIIRGMHTPPSSILRKPDSPITSRLSGRRVHFDVESASTDNISSTPKFRRTPKFHLRQASPETRRSLPKLSPYSLVALGKESTNSLMNAEISASNTFQTDSPVKRGLNFTTDKDLPYSSLTENLAEIFASPPLKRSNHFLSSSSSNINVPDEDLLKEKDLESEVVEQGILNYSKPFMPDFVDVLEPISLKLCQMLAPSTGSAKLQNQLKAKGISTIGQLARLSEFGILQLQIKAQPSKVTKARSIISSLYAPFKNQTFAINNAPDVMTTIVQDDLDLSLVFSSPERHFSSKTDFKRDEKIEANVTVTTCVTPNAAENTVLLPSKEANFKTDFKRDEKIEANGTVTTCVTPNSAENTVLSPSKEANFKTDFKHDEKIEANVTVTTCVTPNAAENTLLSPSKEANLTKSEKLDEQSAYEPEKFDIPKLVDSIEEKFEEFTNFLATLDFTANIQSLALNHIKKVVTLIDEKGRKD